MRQENKSGFFAVHRQITEWRWWHNNTARGIWLYLLTEANWKDGFLRNGELIPRGSLARSLRKMAEDSGVTVNTLRYWLERFARTGEITKTTTQGYTVINIVNYDKYQSFTDGYHTPSDTPTDTPTDTPSDTPSDTDRTKKQSNKETKKQYLSLRARPEREEVESYIFEKNLSVNADDFLLYYNENGWTGSDGEPLKSWKSALISWNKKEKKKTEQKKGLSFYDIE